MKIKFKYKRRIIAWSVVVVVAVVGAIVATTVKIGREGQDVNAHEIEGEATVGAVNGTFPAFYDSRDHYGVRTKNQHSEGTCWLYSGTTALEYALAKKYGSYYEVSVKHLDYITIDGRDVYKQSNAKNIYFDRYLSVDGAFHRWSLGTAGANQELVFGLINPKAIMSESDFTKVLKDNDNRLASIQRYEDLWSLDNVDNLLEPNDEGSLAYQVKQDYNRVNDASKVDYVVTGLSQMRWQSYDASRTSNSEEVRKVKDVINKYGAMNVSVVLPKDDGVDNCSYKKVNGDSAQYTIVNQQGGLCYTNHFMTIVGWDDDWEYEFAGSTRRGAYILQNSWGENSSDKMKWHIGYISALFDMMYVDGIRQYSENAYYYGPDEYKERSLLPSNDELIYELSTDDNVKLNMLTFASLRGDGEYDVYVSTDGTAASFVKDGTLYANNGITEYVFDGEYRIYGNYAIKLKRVDGTGVDNAVRSRETINVMANEYSYYDVTEQYEIGGDGMYFDLTEFRMNVEDFESLLGGDWRIEVDTKRIGDNDYVFTGGETRIYRNNILVDTYKNVIRKDVNGDGLIDTLDCEELKRDIMDDDIEMSNEYLLAGDADENNEINIVDYIRLKKAMEG